jgi:Fur family ferric uptake transcriptional regulator
MTQLDIASVYRNLETLGSLGLVRHFHAGHGPGRYVLEGLGDREYLACESCGALESVEPSALDGVRDQVRELSGFEVRFAHFPIIGLCPACASKRPHRYAAGLEDVHEHGH